ncbi:MAG: NUDIX hydrolase [Bacteroidia bacterium]|nr:NUDIX hydrolase [Bacteroidia bacterium]MCZ2248333.1 NUDIX domain-containing protein [Bacteroidia bacterium]
MYNDKLNTSIQNPHVSVDCVIFGFKEGDLKVLLIERKAASDNNSSPNKKDFLLPGDLVFDNEDLDTSARRILKELTSLENIYLEQFHAFGNPDRVRKPSDKPWLEAIRTEPYARVITIAYYSLVKLEDYKPTASSFANNADWFSLKDIPELAFDHNEIVNYALKVLKSRIQTHPVGFELLPKKFTLSQLQKLYETIMGENLDKRNFRRQFMKNGMLIPLMEKQKHVPHKRAQLFKFNKEKFEAV